MAVVHRALFTWFILLVFLILLVLRLEKRITWSWFMIFYPLMCYDLLLIFCLGFNMMSQCQNGFSRFSNSIQKKICYMLAIMLKLSSQILCCLRLEHHLELSMFYVFLPLWLIIPIILVNVIINVIRPGSNQYL